MFFLHDIPLYAKYTAIYCSQSVFMKSILSSCFQHSKPPMIERFYSKKHIIWKKNGPLINSAKVYQIYSDILELEHFFKEHPTRLFLACKSHASTIHTKLFIKIGFFNDVPIYTKYTAIH